MLLIKKKKYYCTYTLDISLVRPLGVGTTYLVAAAFEKALFKQSKKKKSKSVASVDSRGVAFTNVTIINKIISLKMLEN